MGMYGGCCCRKVYPHEEKNLLIKFFVTFICIQTVFVLILCGLCIAQLSLVDLSFFISIDLTTMMISGVFLSLIVLIIGWAAATNNNTFAWAFFHIFMVLFMVFEITVSWFSSDAFSFAKEAEGVWYSAFDDERAEMQTDLTCCGFKNMTDKPSLPCPQNAEVGCQVKLGYIVKYVQDIATVCLFVDFVFAVFLDFLACAICLNPDVVTLEDQVREELMVREAMEQSADSQSLRGMMAASQKASYTT